MKTIEISPKNEKSTPHIPVLLKEVLGFFDSKNLKNPTLLDCTLGYGGHSKGFLEQNKNAKIIACDQDKTALNFCKKKFENENVKIIYSNYRNIFDILDDDFSPNFILADIGVSSLQLDLDERGFCLNSNSLDMRMNDENPLDAKTFLNTCTQKELEQILSQYGELPNASKIASRIINFRQKKEIKTAKELFEIVGKEKLKGRNVLLATLVFQAIRIHINDELGVLKDFLQKCENKAKNGQLLNTKLAIICFHSLEDKIVKDFFKKWSKDCICDDLTMRCECGKNHRLGQILTKKPITPSIDEIKQNSRSTCAKLRVFEFLNTTLNKKAKV